MYGKLFCYLPPFLCGRAANTVYVGVLHDSLVLTGVFFTVIVNYIGLSIEKGVSVHNVAKMTV